MAAVGGENRTNSMSQEILGITLFDASFSPVSFYTNSGFCATDIGDINNNTRPRITASILMQGYLNSS